MNKRIKLTEEDIQTFSNDEELLEKFNLNIEIHTKGDEAKLIKQQILEENNLVGIIDVILGKTTTVYDIMELVKEIKQLKEYIKQKDLYILSHPHELKEIVEKLKIFQLEIELESKNPSQEKFHSFQPSAVNYYLKKILGIEN